MFVSFHPGKLTRIPIGGHVRKSSSQLKFTVTGGQNSANMVAPTSSKQNVLNSMFGNIMLLSNPEHQNKSTRPSIKINIGITHWLTFLLQNLMCSHVTLLTDKFHTRLSNYYSYMFMFVLLYILCTFVSDAIPLNFFC